MIHRDFILSLLLLLAGLRRIVLEELGQGFLQSSVVLIRVFLRVIGFGAVSAPHQLLFCRVIQVYEQRSTGIVDVWPVTVPLLNPPQPPPHPLGPPLSPNADKLMPFPSLTMA